MTNKPMSPCHLSLNVRGKSSEFFPEKYYSLCILVLVSSGNGFEQTFTIELV